MALEVLAAFLSGVASVIGGVWALRTVRRRSREECDRRIAEVREAYERGFERGTHMEER